MKIKPQKGIDQIEFGMKRADLPSLLGMTPVAKKKSVFSKNTFDIFQDFHVFYDLENNVEAVEVFKGKKPVEIENQNLFSMSRIALEALIQSKGLSFIMENDSLICESLGVSFYIPISKNEPDPTPEGILVFRDGYYD